MRPFLFQFLFQKLLVMDCSESKKKQLERKRREKGEGVFSVVKPTMRVHFCYKEGKKLVMIITRRDAPHVTWILVPPSLLYSNVSCFTVLPLPSLVASGNVV